MQIPNDLTPREAAEALKTLARALEAYLMENGVPESAAFARAQVAGANAWRGARGLPAILPWRERPPVERPRLRLVELEPA
jgi:hypothetical protein